MRSSTAPDLWLVKRTDRGAEAATTDVDARIADEGVENLDGRGQV
jgi:hypothetical protein